jgi:putative FmdB family regulatory protein
MPIYTYRCSSCGVQFDQQQKFSDSSLTRCPECRKNTLHKVFQPVGIVFKGSGFYATDHRSPSGQQARSTSKDKDGSEKPAASSSSSSDSSSSSGGSESKSTLPSES